MSKHELKKYLESTFVNDQRLIPADHQSVYASIENRSSHQVSLECQRYHNPSPCRNKTILRTRRDPTAKTVFLTAI